jgi:hypothetical protein
MQLAENLKLENCVYNRGVTDAMFRQVYSDETLPWANHTIPGVVYASEYDMGTINNAYYDTESYQLNPPPAWNSGWIYRNDGVDIQENSDTMNNNGYKVGFVDTEDWMKLTFKMILSMMFMCELHAMGLQVEIFILKQTVFAYRHHTTHQILEVGHHGRQELFRMSLCRKMTKN